VAVRVLLADDQPLIRAALVMVIADIPDIEVAGEAGTGLEAVRMTRDLRPDVVVMDIRMPGMDGIEATQMIIADGGDTRIVILTTFDEDENVYSALQAGASGFLVKDMAITDILAAIRVVAAGEALIAPKVTRRLIEVFTGRSRHAPAAPKKEIEGITDRERETLTLIGQGLSNTEISEAMVISAATVKSYVTRLLAKLDARDRAQLVIAAYENGLVTARASPPTGRPGGPGGPAGRSLG
jgi:DNA-binding NarL/FixJ family response regulator